jgi:hypothetical protein
MPPVLPTFSSAVHRLRAAALAAFACLIALSFAGAVDDSAKADAIVGRWRWVGPEVVTIRPDGTAASSVGNGTWKCTSKAKPPTYVINWSNGVFIDTLRLIKGGKELSGKNAQGQAINATRLPDLPQK